MGKQSDLKCPNCSYQVLTSGGPDGGFNIFTNTYVCLYCNSLVDLETRKRNDEVINMKDPSEIIGVHQCPKCFGNRFAIWDSIKKLCPRCKTKMTDKFDGPKSFVLWD